MTMVDRVCLLSSDEIFGAGLASILRSTELRLAEVFDSVGEVQESELDSDFLAVVDLDDDQQQADAVAALKALHPSCHIVVLSKALSFGSMVECLKLGANGYILKSSRPAALIASLRLAALGEKVMPSNLLDERLFASTARQTLRSENDVAAAAGLSQRECEVLNHLADGDANKVIARKLDVCEATVKVHVKSILRKLSVDNRTQAAVVAAGLG